MRTELRKSGADESLQPVHIQAVLATQEAELQQQESKLTDRHRAPEEDLGAVESAWWE